MATEKTPNGGELRQRTTAAASKATTNGSAKSSPAAKKGAAASAANDAGFSIGILDVFRALAGLALVSCVASYLVTQGESFTWGYPVTSKPAGTSPKPVKSVVKEPLELTNDQLAAYDGSDSSKPILLALNRTIYDVSSSPQIYGPGGAYSSLAAKDASRSYITTCFDPVDDLVPYFGGVEEIYVPLWLSKKPPKDELDKIGKGDLVYNRDAHDIIDDIHKKIGRKHIKGLRKQAYEDAMVKVQEKVRTWEGMFEKKGYPVVGKVVDVDEEDDTKWRHLSFCADAQKQRPAMVESMVEAFKKVGRSEKLDLTMGRKMMGDKKKKKKKYSKKKHGDIAMEGEGEGKEGGDGEGHEGGEMAAAQLDDMLKGGKFYTEGKRSIEEIMESGPHGDEEAARKAKELLARKKKRGEAPDAVPDEVIPEAADS